MLRSLLAGALVFAAGSTVAAAQDLPDMTGNWRVDVEGVKLQKNDGEAEYNVDHVAPETMQFTTAVDVIIDAQDGFGFFGRKVSANAEESVAGIVDYDNTRVWLVDSDGTTSCMLISADEMSCFYFDINSEDSNLARQKWTRTR
jgi:hypothetical protein